MQLFWHRRDLRTADNRGLARAADAGDVAGLFVIDDDVLTHAGPPRVRFMLDALSALRDRYRDAGSDLVVRRGDPSMALPAVAEALGADRVVWNREYSGLGRERDLAVASALADAGVDTTAVHDAVHHEPGSITTNAGDPYAVFTYYWKKWRDREKADPAPEPGAEDLVGRDGLAAALAEDGTGSLPSLDALGIEAPEASVPPAGTTPARDRLDAFRDGPIFRYVEDRDYPAKGCTSRLSPDLKWGTVGVREVYAATEGALDEAHERAGTAAADVDPDADDAPLPVESVREFQAQLAWREFYTQVLRYNPSVVSENYREYEHDIAWREDPEALAAWKDGRTGYPVVDAGMRQLRDEAFMHNRVRMIVASFLTKDLLLDWRHGYDWFREKLVDHDTANDTGGWQWAASTGTDAQPYFRIFNPMTQGERYDPDAEYVREYVPELRDAPTEAIHGWDDLSPSRRESVAPEYPAPIVDHAERREQALSMFEAARGED